MMDLRINETLQIPMPFRLSRSIGEHSDISELVEDADELAPVWLETAPTGGNSVYLFLVFTIDVTQRGLPLYPLVATDVHRVHKHFQQIRVA